MFFRNRVNLMKLYGENLCAVDKWLECQQTAFKPVFHKMTATVMRLMTATVRLLQSFKKKILKLSITEIIENSVTIV